MKFEELIKIPDDDLGKDLRKIKNNLSFPCLIIKGQMNFSPSSFLFVLLFFHDGNIIIVLCHPFYQNTVQWSEKCFRYTILTLFPQIKPERDLSDVKRFKTTN